MGLAGFMIGFLSVVLWVCGYCEVEREYLRGVVRGGVYNHVECKGAMHLQK